MPNRHQAGCKGCSCPRLPCCPGLPTPATLLQDHYYSECGACCGIVGDPSRLVTTVLEYTPSFEFPGTGVTGPAWVGCSVHENQNGPPSEYSIWGECTDAPNWYAFTGDPATVQAIGIYANSINPGSWPGDACAAWVAWSWEVPGPANYFDPGHTCEEGPGPSPTFVPIRASGVTCSPYSANPLGVYHIYEP